MQSLPKRIQNTNKITLISHNDTSNKIQIQNSKKLSFGNESSFKQNKNVIQKKNSLIQKHNKFSNYDEFKEKPTHKLRTIPLADPFPSQKKHKSNFAYVYNSNGIPCHLQHGTSKLFLQWEKPFEQIDYFNLLPVCFEGLIETTHPYKFAARQSCKELLLADNAYDKVLPLLPKLFLSLRVALNSPDDDVFEGASEITEIV